MSTFKTISELEKNVKGSSYGLMKGRTRYPDICREGLSTLCEVLYEYIQLNRLHVTFTYTHPF
jgi:hypothetical protein